MEVFPSCAGVCLENSNFPAFSGPLEKPSPNPGPDRRLAFGMMVFPAFSDNETRLEPVSVGAASECPRRGFPFGCRKTHLTGCEATAGGKTFLLVSFF